MTNPIQHSMERRSHHHDYSRPGIYHITLHVAEGRGCILGTVVGDPMAADGTPEAPRVELSPVGQMVEHELLTTICTRYPMVEVQDHVVMPDHLHALVAVKKMIISPSGKRLPLGQVIAGFKKGCNKRYWEMTSNGGGETATHTAPGASVSGVSVSGVSVSGVSVSGVNVSGVSVSGVSVSGVSVSGVSVSGVSVSGGFPAGTYKVPSDCTSGRPTLFSLGYCDVMPVDEEQLATQRAYIQGNPRSRLLRLSHREWLTTQRGVIKTALTPSALMGYLRRECAPSHATPETLATIAERLLTRPGKPAGTLCPTVSPSGQEIVCDSYGDRTLLERRLLPVVCHRHDKPRFAEQKQRCLEEAQRGTVLVSPRIAKGEQEIIDEAVLHGFPVVIIHDNGFPERYHPSASQLDRCAEGRLLLVTPWRYHYRPKDEAITVAECKTMNCVAQSLCRQKDSWWKEKLGNGK